MKKLRNEIDSYIRQNLSPKRYSHSLGAESAAIRIAGRFSLPVEKCSIAALAHDICREKSPEELMDLSGRIHPVPILLHGDAGARFLEKNFAIEDGSILEAVRHHISGHPGMDSVGKAVFAADFLEEGRTFLDRAERERLFSLDLDDMVLEIAQTIKSHCEKRNLPVEPALEEMIGVLI